MPRVERVVYTPRRTQNLYLYSTGEPSVDFHRTAVYANLYVHNDVYNGHCLNSNNYAQKPKHILLYYCYYSYLHGSVRTWTLIVTRRIVFDSTRLASTLRHTLLYVGWARLNFTGVFTRKQVNPRKIKNQKFSQSKTDKILSIHFVTWNSYCRVLFVESGF